MKTLSTPLLACYLLFITDMHAQEWQANIDTYFTNIRTGASPKLPKEANDAELADDILNSMKPYFRDSTESVKIKSYELCYYVATRSTFPAIRTKGVELLLAACTTGDAKTTGIILDMLSTLDKKDFSQMAKAEVIQFLQDKTPHLSGWIKLAGFLNLRELIPRIRPYSQPGNPQSSRWAALLSLARMDEQWATAEILVRVKRLPLNDDLVYRIFPDLVFTRQRAAIDHMIEVLHQDNKSCLTADAEREEPIPCGYRVMEQLAPVIDGFPLQTGEGGDIVTTDYQAALALVRNWFHQHKNYQLLVNRY